MKRLLSLLLIFALFLMQAPFALATDSAQAVTLRLEAIEGKVSLHNQRKKAITCRAGMKLLSGYTISTEAASYAYVSLDKDKAIKLDGLSTASIQKKGKKLELLLSSGKLFFNVKVPLKPDETMEVRTSTMVTGIRGTAGVLESLSANESQLLLLSGQVEVSSYHPTSGHTKSVSIHAGQRATFLAHEGTDAPEVLVAELTPADIPASVAVEIAQDPDLQTAISEQSRLPLNEVLQQANGLTQEKSTQTAVQKKSETQQKQQKQTESTTNNRPGGSNGGGSNGGGGATPEPPTPELPTPEPPTPEKPSPEDPGPEDPGPEDPGPEDPGPEDPGPEDPGPEDPGPEDPGPEDPGPEDPGPEDPGPEDPGPEDPGPEDPDPPHSDTTTLDATIDADQINAAFQHFKTVQLSGSCSTMVPLSIPVDKTLRLLSGAHLSAATAGTLTINGTLIVDNGAQLQGNTLITLTRGTIDNAGTISLKGSGTIILHGGRLNNAGSVFLADSAALTCISEDATTLKLSNSGTLHLEKKAKLICNARFENSGTLSSDGGLFLARHLDNSGTIPALSMTYQDTAYATPSVEEKDKRQTASTIYVNNLSELLSIVPNEGLLTLTDNISSNLIGTAPSVPQGKALSLNAGVYQIDMGGETLHNAGILTLVGSGNNNHLTNTTGQTPADTLLQNVGTLTLQDWNVHAAHTALASIGGALRIESGTVSSDSAEIADGYALSIDTETRFSFRNSPLIRAKSQSTVFANGFPTGATVTSDPDHGWFKMVPPNA